MQFALLDINGLCAAVDFVNIMSYDLHGAWDPITNHQVGENKHVFDGSILDVKIKKVSSFEWEKLVTSLKDRIVFDVNLFHNLIN